MKRMFYDSEEEIARWRDGFAYVISTIVFCLVLIWTSGILR